MKQLIVSLVLLAFNLSQGMPIWEDTVRKLTKYFLNITLNRSSWSDKTMTTM
jgi:hypothetical protein